MTENVDSLILEHLKRIQAELAESKARDKGLMARLAHIEAGVARIGRDQASSYSEIVEDRHAVDRLRERIERIERRLDLVDPG